MATFQFRSGAWRAIIRRKGYETRTATFDYKEEAEAWARKVEHEMDVKKIGTERAKGVVADLWRRYLDEVSPHKKGHRWEGIRLRAWTDEVPKPTPHSRLGMVRLEDLTHRDVKTWRDARIAAVSGATVIREMALLSSVFTHAINEWDIPIANPVAKVSRPKGAPPRDRVFSDADVALILERFEHSEDLTPTRFTHYVPWAFLFAIETAMRRGEILGMRWEWVHDDYVHVHRSISKTGVARDVPLSPRAQEILNKMPKEKFGPFPVNPDSFDVLWRRRRPKGWTFHDTRHTGTTRLAKKVFNVLELAAITGHEDLNMLKIYFNPSASDLAKKLV